MNVCFVLLLPSLVSAHLTGLRNQSFENPVVPVDAPDPGVQFLNGTWVMVTTGKDSLGGAYTIRTSSDLVDWKITGAIFPTGKYPKWSNGIDFWAPEIHAIPTLGSDGVLQYNAYFTARTKAGVMAIGVASAPMPTGPFQDSGSPLIEDPVGAIDATFFAHENGQLFVIWKTDGNSQGKTCVIRMQELTANGLAVKTGANVTDLITNDRAWEGPIVEAPWIIKVNSTYFLFYSGRGYASSNYAVGVAKSQSIYGPYVKACAPVMSQYATDPSSETRSFAGPGHCSVVSLGGSSYAMVYHAWRTGHITKAPGRNVLVDPVVFGSDGWPRVGTCNTPSNRAQPIPTTNPTAFSGASSACLQVGSAYRMETSQWENHAWNNDGTINGDGDHFVVREGNCGGGAVSFESASFRGYFLRHKNGFLELDVDNSSALFAYDSSFMARPGVLGGEKQALVSFRSTNYPQNYLRHENGRLQLSAFQNTLQFAQDARFRPRLHSQDSGFTQE
eukprot:m.472565 g.472565  ORF g.472565 m.472565 type:complete len:502 (+) comp21661_c3_seq26:201-1706(+)